MVSSLPVSVQMGDPAGGMGAQPMQMPGAPGYPAQVCLFQKKAFQSVWVCV